MAHAFIYCKTNYEILTARLHDKRYSLNPVSIGFKVIYVLRFSTNNMNLGSNIVLVKSMLSVQWKYPFLKTLCGQLLENIGCILNFCVFSCLYYYAKTTGKILEKKYLPE